jgi:hypothetical protein
MSQMPSELENWYEAFEMLGPETLRLRMEMRRAEYDGAYGRAAEKWLLEKRAQSDRLEEARYRTIKRWTVIAGVAGVIAAVAAIAGLVVAIASLTATVS